MRTRFAIAVVLAGCYCSTTVNNNYDSGGCTVNLTCQDLTEPGQACDPTTPACVIGGPCSCGSDGIVRCGDPDLGVRVPRDLSPPAHDFGPFDGGDED